MRFVTCLLVPPGDGLHPLERELAANPALRRVAIHHFRMLEDGTAVVMYELEGTAAAVERTVGDAPELLSYDLVESDGRVFGHVHIDTDDLTSAVYGIAQRHELVLDMPLTYTDEGAMQFTAVGDQATFRQAVREMPDGVRIELLRMGEYVPDDTALYGQLTPRQQETLVEAIRQGYYEQPRAVTYEDIAEALDVAPGTVGDHLRRVEATVLKEIVPDSALD